jgi:hypothetical protein
MTPACLLHLWLGEAEGLVTHVSVIGERPVVTVFDDGRWIERPVVPEGFHPRA